MAQVIYVLCLNFLWIQWEKIWTIFYNIYGLDAIWLHKPKNLAWAKSEQNKTWLSTVGEAAMVTAVYIN